MNGSDGIKKAAIDKAKKVAGAASNGQGGKKRKTDLKPIITTEQQAAAQGNPYR
jgi:serine/threonine-protein kinase SRPK3